MGAPSRHTILHVLSPAPVGGLERVVHALAVGHHRRGHRVHVAALVGGGSPPGAFLAPLLDAEVPVHTLPIRMYSVVSERRFVRSLCGQHRVEVLHTHGYRPDVVDSGVARRLGIATVTTEHGMSRMGGRTRLYEWLQLRSFRHFDAVAAVSRPIVETLLRGGVPPERIHLVPNAWSGDEGFLDRSAARRALQLRLDAPVAGWVGRLIGAKGADVFLRAVARLGDLDLQVALIGDGPERGALERLCASLGLGDRVRFHGVIPDARRHFRAFDAFVLSSRTEGTPVVLFEAMASETPIVATRVGGVPDVVGDEEAALVSPEDPTLLAEALRRTLEDAPGAALRARRAREQLGARYALEPWLDRYERVYRTALDGRGA